MKALRVTQIGKVNRIFIVTNPKKFTFWINLGNAESGLMVSTTVKKINI